jgi:hypothetical protein
MATCRCSICGKKNAGKARNGKLRNKFRVSRDEANRSIDYGSDRDCERRLLRRRMKQNLNTEISEFYE